MLSINSSEDFVENERKVISACLNSAEDLTEATMKLTAHDFSDFKNAHVFGAIAKLKQENMEVNAASVVGEIKTTEGLQFDSYESYVLSLDADAGAKRNFSSNLEIVKKASVKRQIDALATDITSKSIGLSDFDIELDKYSANVSKVISTHRSGTLVSIATAVTEFENKIAMLMNSDGALNGVPTGIEALDNELNGLKNGELIVVAGRPGTGKTAFALNVLLSAAKIAHSENLKKSKDEKKSAVIIFSLEMTKLELMERLVKIESMVGKDIKSFKSEPMSPIEESSYSNAMDLLKGLPIFINDSASVTENDIRAAVTQYSVNYDIKLVVIDYIQKVSSTSKNAQLNEQVAKSAWTMKIVAKECQTPVVALAQLSRKVEDNNLTIVKGIKKTLREPQMSDLADSSGIEKDANIIAFLWNEDDKTNEDGSLKYTNTNNQIVKFICRKNRNGNTFSANIMFKKNIQKFVDISNGKGGL